MFWLMAFIYWGVMVGTGAVFGWGFAQGHLGGVLLAGAAFWLAALWSYSFYQSVKEGSK